MEESSKPFFSAGVNEKGNAVIVGCEKRGVYTSEIKMFRSVLSKMERLEKAPFIADKGYEVEKEQIQSGGFVWGNKAERRLGLGACPKIPPYFELLCSCYTLYESITIKDSKKRTDDHRPKHSRCS